jgi:Family of unknown function (DUF5681)
MSEGEADNPKNDSQPPTDEGEPPYRVGNKKPPKQFQFKPGHSGNPKGRPKGSTSLEDKLQKELRKLVTVTKNGKPVKMSKLDVAVRRLVDRLMTGDVKLISILMGLGKKNEKSKTGEETADTVAMPDDANIEFIVGRLKGLIKGGAGGASDE